MKFRFTIPFVLLLILVCAAGLSFVAIPRLKRHGPIAKLEQEPIVQDLTYGDRDFLDRLLGVDGPIVSIWFRGDRSEDLLTKEVFEISAACSPLYSLEVEDLHVEICSRYPRAEYITIRNLTGRQSSEWLNRLLAVQADTKEIEIDQVLSLSDKHIETLGSVDCDSLESIDLSWTSVTGVGFGNLSSPDRKIKLGIGYCPITDDGLKAIATCNRIKELTIEFNADYNPLPDLQLLLHAPRTLDLCVLLDSSCFSDPTLTSDLKKLDNYFGYPVAIFEQQPLTDTPIQLETTP